MGPAILASSRIALRLTRGPNSAPDVTRSSWVLPEGTGVGKLRNPSDPVSQGLKSELAGSISKESSLSFASATTNSDHSDDDDASGFAANPKKVVRVKFRPMQYDTKANPLAPVAGLPDWNAVMWNGKLYVSVSSQQLTEGSKDAFVSLLEYAEEELQCSHVIVCLDKSVGEANMKTVIRNFLFLGFQPLAPGHELLPPNYPNLVSFVYNI